MNDSAIAIVFANLKGNIGDFAILHAMLLDIQKKFPNPSIDVYSHGFLPVDNSRFAAFAIKSPTFKLVGKTFAPSKKLGRLSGRLLKTIGLLSRYQEIRIRSLATESMSAAKRFSRYDAVFIIGGAQWTGLDAGVSMFATLRAIATHTDRIFTYPFSVSSGVTQVGTKTGIKADLGKIQTPLIVRDGMSRQVLEELGLTPTQGVDCVFSLFGVARNIPPHPHRDPSRVLLVVTKQETAEVTDKLHSLKDQVGPITLLTTCAIEDEPVLKAAAAAAGVPYLAPETWQETIAEMKSSALVISNRLHGLIFSSLAEVPVLPLINRSKVAGVAKDAGLDLCAAEWSDLDAGIIHTALSQGTAIAAKFGRYRDKAVGSYYSPIGPRAVLETARHL